VANEKWTGNPAIERADLMRKAKAAGMTMQQLMATFAREAETKRYIALMSQMIKTYRRGRSK
jgi:hypothetical protein